MTDTTVSQSPPDQAEVKSCVPNCSCTCSRAGRYHPTCAKVFAPKANAPTEQAAQNDAVREAEPLIARLRAKHQVFPAQGGGTITYGGEASHYITDDGKRLINPDGPAAADLIEHLLATPPAPVEGVDLPNTEHWVKRSDYNRLYQQFDLKCREVNELRATASPAPEDGDAFDWGMPVLSPEEEAAIVEQINGNPNLQPAERLSAPGVVDGVVEAWLIERLDGESMAYRPARSVVDARKYDASRADYFVNEEARRQYRVTPLGALSNRTPSVSSEAG